MTKTLLTRRQLLGALAGSGAALGLGQGAASAMQAGPARMVMHRSPSCGCCLGWVDHARRAGFTVSIQNSNDMQAVKRRLGVPEALASCHTVEVGGYVVEGHVPLADVTRLLRERPRGVRGLAVPGMPAGSPGMEMPGGERQPFTTFAFDARGGRRVFARHAGNS